MLNFLLGTWGASNPSSAWIASSVQTRAGIPLSYDSALNFGAVWCATRVLAEANSVCPILIYRRTDTHDRDLDRDHPANRALRLQPNNDMGITAFREGRTMHQVNWGNGFAEIAEGADGEVQLYPIHPSRVKLPMADELARGYAYRIKSDAGDATLLRASEMLHVPGVLSEDGIWGKGVIQYARESIGGGLAVEKHGWDYFGTGAQPKGVLTTPGVKDNESRAALRAEWKRIHGQNSGEIAIFPPSSEYKAITLPNEASQFIQTRKHNIGEIGRWYRVPVYMLEEYEKAASFASVEQRGIDFVTFSLLPWIRKWEDELNRKLIGDDPDTFIECQLGGLLRGDLKSRYDAYVVAIQNGWLSINEVRRLENLNSIGPAGDQHFVQLNMTTAEAILDGSARPTTNNLDSQQMFDAWTRKALGLRQTRGNQLRLKHRRQRRTQLTSAAHNVLHDTLLRMFTKEAKAVERAFTSPTFPDWLKEFHHRHRNVLADALGPTASVLILIDKLANPTQLATTICAHSADQLLLAFNTHTKAEFLHMLHGWPANRATFETNCILAPLSA
jgi:HK97 family phage portal protein